MTLTQYLKSETESAHVTTERAFSRYHLFQEDFSLVHYQNLLITQYQWHALLEAKYIDQLPFEYLTVKKSELIHEDLAKLGITNLELPAIELPHLDSLGVAYVIEGSMMGSAMIYKFLSRQELPTDTLRFYHHCSSTGVRGWPELKKKMDSLDLADKKREEVLSSAHYSFDLALKLANAGE